MLLKLARKISNICYNSESIDRPRTKSIARNRRGDWSPWNPVTYIRTEWKKEGNGREKISTTTTTFFVVGPASSRTHGAGLAGCGARCICNEGMRVSDNRCIAPTGCARCIKPPGGCIDDCRAPVVALAISPLLLIQPGALKCNPSRGWFIPRQCPPAGQDVARSFFMSLSLVSKISCSARMDERTRFDTYVYSRDQLFADQNRRQHSWSRTKE